MSKAGIQSNRGDGYQTLIAFDWALTILSSADYEWLEIDSVTSPVDDVVIGRADGVRICCQCKKNQSSYKAWSVSDLGQEVEKAGKLLAADPKASVRFYSRSPFGELAALKEFGASYPDESLFHAHLGKAHRDTESQLRALLEKNTPSVSTYEFLQRTSFEGTPGLGDLRRRLFERLANLSSNASAAFNTLWAHLDQLGMRLEGHEANTAVRHRLSKEDLASLLNEAGAMIAPPMDVSAIQASFHSISAIGRSWQRAVRDQRLDSPSVREVMQAIEAKHRSILLTGAPGSGKTCVMLAVQDELERIFHAGQPLVPLFIQSREFSDAISAQERSDIGLANQWVQQAARMAERAHVVVLIDSLDVLSIAREHTALKYFLAQIDRLLTNPNVTVVTACREFDCSYDRSIAQRIWDKKITCEPFDWERDIAPLLGRLHIDASGIDINTRQLLCNPRELALYVELAQQGETFNVVTSQALAERYLEETVLANSELGDIAMTAVEALATEMLTARSLSIPRQRFKASTAIERVLLSNNVLVETRHGQLSFGHQTLLDVLVISGATRANLSLDAFIRQLPPVPFVRPTIRSFVAHLAAGDRRQLRLQLRMVLTGSHAFHVRRLVAESFAEQVPHDNDWPLVRDLWAQHREIFQVIYAQASRVEWHYFWMKHLLPVLTNTRDREALTMHAQRVCQWANVDAAGVSSFWHDVLEFDYLDKPQLAVAITYGITRVDNEFLPLFGPLVVKLLNAPRPEHDFLGEVLAACIRAGAANDELLWHYVTGEICDADLLAFKLGNKLHCQPHEFGKSGGTFIAARMKQSTDLLDMAVATIERWSAIRRADREDTPTSYWRGFLRSTSYEDAHSQTDKRHLDSERLLLDAIESAVVSHASVASPWWSSNRRRLSFSSEGALRYFAVLACTAAPSSNLDIIGQLLCEKALLDSDLAHELGTLIHAAFWQLPADTQDAVQATILTISDDDAEDPIRLNWIRRRQAQLILAIPRHLRLGDAQRILDECERDVWPLIRNPVIYMSGGFVNPPFSFQVFLDASDEVVFKLLAHYDGHDENWIQDTLVAGEREVGRQLDEAASRHPTRFMNLLSIGWTRLSDSTRENILSGASRYLAHRHGNLRPNGEWSPQDEPAPETLANLILAELEAHPIKWRHTQIASEAIEGCASVVSRAKEIAKVIEWAADFSTLREQSSISGDSVNLLTKGLNMSRGRAVEALMRLASKFAENDDPSPATLAPALRLFANDHDPAVRALMLRHLPYLQSRRERLGWQLFRVAMRDASGLWGIAEPCLYHAYHRRFGMVRLWLARIFRSRDNEALETWGRISALAVLSQHITVSAFLNDLDALGSKEAWRGAANVWTNAGNLKQHQQICLTGLFAGLFGSEAIAAVVAECFIDIFARGAPMIEIPIELLRRYFDLQENKAAASRSDVFGLDVWLNTMSLLNPTHALDIAEIYIRFIKRKNIFIYNYENNLTQLLTRLFAQAEEQEQADGGAMLARVVDLQDALLSLNVNGVSDWLKAAERL
ncbi:AAA ATPase central domain protein [Burkholderia sp. MR1]|nr:AAA ATPase central domain protein [Burkholderia sp. MR1]